MSNLQQITLDMDQLASQKTPAKNQVSFHPATTFAYQQNQQHQKTPLQ